jgi:hypothetical protein
MKKSPNARKAITNILLLKNKINKKIEDLFPRTKKQNKIRGIYHFEIDLNSKNSAITA